jgi:hypothetical protein
MLERVRHFGLGVVRSSHKQKRVSRGSRLPSDVSDEEWAFVVPYLALMTLDAPQRQYDLREVYNVRSALHGTLGRPVANAA